MGAAPGQDRAIDLRWRRGDLRALLALSVAALAAAIGPIRADKAPPPGTRTHADRLRRACERIDPNTASAASLERLPGVGPVTAGAIVADRQARPGQAYTCPEDLARVKGIGAGTVQRLRPHLTFPPAR